MKGAGEVKRESPGYNTGDTFTTHMHKDTRTLDEAAQVHEGMLTALLSSKRQLSNTSHSHTESISMWGHTLGSTSHWVKAS